MTPFVKNSCGKGSHYTQHRRKRTSFLRLSEDLASIRDVLTRKGPLTTRELSREIGLPLETLRRGRLPYAERLGFVKKVGRKWDIVEEEDLIARRLKEVHVPIDEQILRKVLQEFRRPTLAFGGFSANNEPACFAKFEKVRGAGKAEACEAFLTLKDENGRVVTNRGVRFEHMPTIWASGLRVQDVGDYENLRLFRVGTSRIACHGLGEEKAQIWFPAASFERKHTHIGELTENPFPIENAGKAYIEVRVTSKNAEVKPAVLKVGILEILKECGVNEQISL